jgi:hypothetical protein
MNHKWFANAEGGEHERLIESLIRDGSTHLWVGDEFFRHICSVLERLPIDVLRQLGEKEFRFLAPERVYGRVCRWNRPLQTGEIVVFLSPELLGRPLEEIQADIAHELAHLLLGHEEAPVPDAAQEARNGENEADALVRSWGFELRARMFQR